MNSIIFLPAMDRDLEIVLNDVKLNSVGFLETFCSQKMSEVKFDQESSFFVAFVLLMTSVDEIIVHMSAQVKYFEKKLA